MTVKSAIAFLFLSLMMGHPVRLGGQAIAVSSVLEAMPKDLEVRLALSALPPYLRSDATVYVLDPAKGYTAEQRGSARISVTIFSSRSVSTRRAQGRLYRYLSMSPGFEPKENSLQSD